MPSDREVQRLVQVYRAYRESQAVQAQWDEGNPGWSAILQERQRAIRRLLGSHGLFPLAGRKALEVGCGSGKVLASLLELGAQSQNLYGVDLLPDRISEAQQRYPELNFQCANAEQMEFPEASFDLVLLFTVFSSILDEQMARSVAYEVSRVLRPGGAVLWYDFRYDNPRNPNVRGVTRGNIETLFPGFNMRLRTITLLPPLARGLGCFTRVLYPLLAAIPPLRTHYLGLLIRPPFEHGSKGAGVQRSRRTDA
jgi:SAM-dependent methyltransferase